MEGQYRTTGLLVGLVVPLAATILLCGAKPLTSDTRQLLDQLYQTISGYGIDQTEIEHITQQGGNDTYGEITFDGVVRLCNLLNVGANDIFYDLGCGVGKMVLQVYLDTPVRKSVGVELSASRVAGAQKALEQLKRRRSLPSDRQVRFVQGNVATVDLSDATVVYMASTCFSDALMRQMVARLAKLRKGLRVATLVQLPDAQAYGFRSLGDYMLPMSWDEGGNWVYLYQLE